MASPEPGIEVRPQYIACATDEIKPLVKLVCEAAPKIVWLELCIRI